MKAIIRWLLNLGRYDWLVVTGIVVAACTFITTRGEFHHWVPAIVFLFGIGMIVVGAIGIRHQV